MTQFDTPDPVAIDLVRFETAHLPGALALSQAVGWPHRAEDWALTLSVSQGVAAVVDGRIMGTALCSLHGPVATLNMIIVDAALRGRGIGLRLMEAIIDLAGDRELRLVATEEGKPLYRKLGFVDVGRILQLQGMSKAAPPERAVEAGPADPELLARMDFEASGMARAALLDRIAREGRTLRTEGGFALLRAFGRGHVLGPVVARDPGAARALMAAGASHLAGSFLRMDLPEAERLAPFAETLGLRAAGGGTAMVRAACPRAPSPYQTYALISQALG
ncbi:GNAT family N-acetyltransferase [Salipiger marinus]|uniref:Acetyltransferase (GNAT) family protein n=1 Tax=Salipiger marinus TaxID=555512 RepID=A0A1G8M6G2_9RHOB|nr:GNAT family N-acetyltransferase [Salipiger marinus]SDI63485.1 Acetyltransferase (GNAT) family protein [Salipiger marinus]